MHKGTAFLAVLAALLAPLKVEAVEVAKPGVTPLYIPRGQRIEQSGDFRGALLLSNGRVFQIDEITWYVTVDGRLTIRHFTGFDPDGKRVESSNTEEKGGRDIDSPAAFRDFTLGRPDTPDNQYRVSTMSLGVDPSGYVCIASLEGTAVRSGKRVSVTRSLAVLCGLRVNTGCTLQGSCTTCGAYPGCPCTAGTGTCSGFSESICSGDCDSGQHCNGSVANCSCVVNGPGVSPWGLGLLAVGILSVSLMYLKRRFGSPFQA